MEPNTQKKRSPLLCRIGMHKISGDLELLPGGDAMAVQQMIYTTFCTRCGKQFSQRHETWNEDSLDFEPTDKNQPNFDKTSHE